jgi:hypothetical protein
MYRLSNPHKHDPLDVRFKPTHLTLSLTLDLDLVDLKILI